MPENFSSFNKSQNSLKQYSQRGFSVKGTSLSAFVWLQEILTRFTADEGLIQWKQIEERKSETFEFCEYID